MNLIDYLERQDRAWLLKLATLLVFLVGSVNYLVGVEISLFILYLLPVSLVSWFVGNREGVFIAFGSSASWYVVEWFLGRQYSRPVLHFWNGAVLICFFMIINFAVAAFKEAMEKEKNLARVDSLTGLTNSMYFHEMIKGEIERSRRYRHPMALLYLDCDNFKKMNDKYGHQIGNRFLRYLATILESNIRITDTVARLGGDEFAILMPETGREFVPYAVERLHSRLVGGLHKAGWPVTLSLGAAIHLDPPGSAEELIKSADRLMLRAKSEGKNKIQYGIFECAQNEERRPLHLEKSYPGFTILPNQHGTLCRLKHPPKKQGGRREKSPEELE